MEHKTSNNAFRTSLHGLPYAETVAQKPPIRVKSSTSLRLADDEPADRSPDQSTPSPAHFLTTGEMKPNGSDGNGAFLSAPRSPLTQISSQTSLPTIGDGSTNSFASSSSIPRITFDQPLEDEKDKDKKSYLGLKPTRSKSSEQRPQSEFKGLTLDLSTSEGFAEELSTESMMFSKRGSMLLDGRKVGRSNTKNKQSIPLRTISDNQEGKKITIADNRSPRPRTSPRPRPAAKILTIEEEGLSEQVRSFYTVGSDVAYESDAASSIANKIGNRWQDSLGVKTEASSMTTLSRGTSATDIHAEDGTKQNGNRRSSAYRREETELAGGIEDWQDVENADVDRYGFIIPKQDTINGLSRSRTAKDRTGISRVSTSLQLATEQPRRRGTVRRAASGSHGPQSAGILRSPSEKSLQRPRSSASGGISRHSTFRSRDQKAVDQAGDMLTLPRTSSMLMGTGESASNDPRARRKEIERQEKWRKMAHPVPSTTKGGGMTFDFDTHSPKLIERTWKGVPDKWRASAWHAFLSASARKDKESLSDEDLIAAFEDYQTESSPDDVQIDIDVPRTISSHIMFRRRYRGGQRLLFRVLHAMSLHFGETGYVQGMAALAATLLAYYEEEKAFIMLVRLWDLRGLDKLYKSGFGGLMAALDDFEKKWLSDGELAKKLEELNIGPTAYGTRWYLTLFNYSIPFPAQLRVWDVFMLLGDDNGMVRGGEKEDVQFGTTLDVLHATSAALIDGMRDILMESDFENCMKVLTSWIPIKDEDMLMRVAKAEWKTHRQKGRA